MTCNYIKNLPHIQIHSRPNSKIGNFSSSNPITTDYAKSKWSGLGANFNVEILGNVQVVSRQDSLNNLNKCICCGKQNKDLRLQVRLRVCKMDQGLRITPQLDGTII